MNRFEQTTMPSVLDREISDPTRDAFGHQHFAQALRGLIETETYEPPFSIGLLGPWGTGKSTIKELYLADLKNDRSGKRGEQRKDRIYPITFNAWRYGGDDIKRSLLRHAFLALGGDEPTLRRELYQQVSQSSQARRPTKEWLKEATLQNLASVGIFILLLAGTLSLALLYVKLTGLTTDLSLTLITSLTIILAGFLAKYVVDIRLKSPTLFNPTTTISFPLTSAEEYEQLLIKQLKEFKESKKGNKCQRLVVFVDDLDRLSAIEMVAGLDAIRAFLELQTSVVPDAPGVVFVISCDEDRVAEALARGRGRSNVELPGSVFTRSDARRYLDRLFQFRLEIPPFPKIDMRKYAVSKLSIMDSLVQDLEDRGVHIQDLVERLIHVNVRSPRNALQLLNAFAESWWIASRRERAGIGSNESGALHEGAVTNHPMALAALCVLRTDFPDFFNYIQKRPELIKEISNILFRNTDVQTLPIDGRLALKEFFVIGSDGNITSEIRPEYRDLRQYLSSIQGLRWPERLQPLLLLAEDAITRRYGDKAAQLHDAFISGDTQGVLEIFGRELDTKRLAPEDIQLLEDLVEEVNQDTDVRRINAARVLAELAPRVPDEYARNLMTPLARQLIDYKAVRMNIGPVATKEIIRHTVPVDQQEVAAQFCSDLLHSEIIEWQLPTGETPNLEEIVQIVRETVDLALYVRKYHGLPEKPDQSLRTWLLSREIRIVKQSYTLPFSQLETWVAENSDHLLQDLGADFTDQVISEFEADETSIKDIDGSIGLLEQVFDRLAKEGQESRTLLWNQLTRMIAVHSSEAVNAARKGAESYSDLASDAQACNFLSAMSNRLLSEMKDQDEWALDRESGAITFLGLITQWSKMIDARTAKVISQLIITWSDVDETAEFAAGGCRSLEVIDTDAWNGVIDHLVTQPFGKLPWATRKVVAEELDKITDSQKDILLSQLNQVINTDIIDDKVAEDYVSFIKVTPVDAWRSTPLQSHLIALFARLEAMFNNQNDYLTKLFSAGVSLFNAAPDGRVGTFLSQLFAQAAGSLVAYPAIHKGMIGAWPEETAKIGSYRPSQIIERAVQFIEQHPSVSDVGFVFESIVDIVDRKLATEDDHPKISKAAAVIWPHSPSSVYKCINNVADLLMPSDINGILTGSQPPEYSTELEKIVNLVAEKFTEGQHITVARELINVAPVQLNSHPDGALVMWLNALRSNEASVLNSLLGADDLNETQRERLYQYAVNRKNELGLQFFIVALPRALQRSNDHSYLDLAVRTSSDIGELAKSNDDRAELCDSILPTLPGLSGEHLVTLIRLIRQLGGRGALERDTQTINKMDDDALSVVVQEIPDSRILKRALEDRHG